jgi:A/G-specific adenine glycosylase
MNWHKKKNTRLMPWKGEKDPYKIWLSEIILQQTRVEQGWDYYNRFVSNYRTIQDLAKAPELEVFKLWEGLGYYARCRNLLHTARVITNEYQGVFPKTYNEVVQLKGIGPYTAAAITSFAFGLPHAVIDGNVLRVLARIFGISDPIDGKTGKLKLTALADSLLDRKNPGLYNQAIMDFGAVVCKPALPLCHSCPAQKICLAHINDLVSKLPVKGLKINRKKRWFYYFLLEKNDHVLVRQRVENDIWQQLHEFYLMESGSRQSPKKLMESMQVPGIQPGKTLEMAGISGEFRQLLTHQEIMGRFIRIRISGKFVAPPGFFWVNRAALKKIAFPKFILSYLAENG